MRRLDAISILTLVLSIGALVITAVGTGGVEQPAGGASPSSPIVVGADGREVGALVDIVGDGEVGVMLVGGDSL